MHTLVVDASGTLWSWGVNDNAALGRLTTRDPSVPSDVSESIPHRVEGLGHNGKGFEQAECSHSGTTGHQKVRLLGNGAYHSFAVDASENAWVWGLNMRQQSGLDLARGDVIETPTLIPALSRSNKSCELLDGVTIIQISAGSAHSLVLLSNGDILGCGRSDGGEIGLADDHEVMRDVQE
ncbi:hypothetical protein OC861_007035 [Tilletia horrida]|nr:hypothetical protein OC861_007035 [Tilletia horrida]